MQATLLEETMPRTSRCGRKTQMLVGLLVGFGAGVVVMSTMGHFSQEPAVDMAALGASMGSARQTALPRNAPMWLRSPARAASPVVGQPLGAMNVQQPSGFMGASRPLYGSPMGINVQTAAAARPSVAVYAGEEKLQLLKNAIQAAEDCIGECAVEWDNVEELSAAVADADKPAIKAKLTKEDVDVIKATKEKLSAAREKMSKESGSVDESVLKEIASSLAPFKAVGPKVSKERMAKLDAALQEALAAAKACTGEECAVLWETVEELSEAKNPER